MKENWVLFCFIRLPDKNMSDNIGDELKKFMMCMVISEK